MKEKKREIGLAAYGLGRGEENHNSWAGPEKQNKEKKKERKSKEGGLDQFLSEK